MNTFFESALLLFGILAVAILGTWLIWLAAKAITNGKPSDLLCNVTRWLRRFSPWLFALGLALLYPHLRLGVADYVADAAPLQDRQAVAAQVSSQWVNLTGPASKLLLAGLAFAVGLGLAWLALNFIVPVLANWARGHYLADGTNDAADFKYTFLHLSRAQQMAVFCLVWLALLLFFGLCWLAACLVQ